jgi:osmotically-inducible protein OsmY
MPVQEILNDTAIAAAARRALVDDLAVPDATIRVFSTDGVVRLEGTVTSLQERDEAARAVAAVPGVRRVWNQIGVWPPDVESEVVREMTRELLASRARERVTATNGS